MIYVILGMHKSGTTLLANILHNSDVSMIDTEAEGVDYDNGGQFERAATNSINKELLRCGDHHSLEVIRPAPPHEWTDAMRARADEVVSGYNRTYSDWGFKDPRTCLSYDFWQESLGTHKVLCIYRDPEEVVSHYLAQSGGFRAKFGLPLATRALRAWCIYNRRILAHAGAGGRPWLTLSYADLMRGGASFAALETFVGRRLEDRRFNNQYRSRGAAGRLYRLAKRRVARSSGLDVDAIRLGLESMATRGNSV